MRDSEPYISLKAEDQGKEAQRLQNATYAKGGLGT